MELYTKPYADGYEANRELAVASFVEASRAAHQAGLGVNAGHDLNLQNLAYFHARVPYLKVGLGVNAGHDLNLDNLAYFHKHLPYLNEVSIGHAIIADALYLGIGETIRRYRECLV